MKQFFQSLTSFTKRERRGAFVFLFILLVLIIINRNVSSFVQSDLWFIPEDTAKLNEWIKELQTRTLNLKPFNPNEVNLEQLIEMGLPASICETWSNYIDAGGEFYNKTNVRRLYGMPDSVFFKLEPYLIIPQKRKSYYKEKMFVSEIREIKDFNPNTFTKEELIESGLTENVASNILNYRKSGGGFFRKEDLMKLYAVNEKTYNQIKSHVIIDNKADYVVSVDSVELNSTTLDELIDLGVKKKVASNILGYRKALGGYYTKEQLKDVYHMNEHSLDLLLENTWIDTLLIKRIDLNHANLNNLSTHPYISSSQARQLIKYKNFAERINNFQEIRDLKIFPNDLASKLRFYFAF
jgi:DNA uptake protein ComE-like DNA-binding protein